jgi:hypothetical protein
MFTGDSNQSAADKNLADRLQSFDAHKPMQVKPSNPLFGNLAATEDDPVVDEVVEEVIADDLADEGEAAAESTEESTDETETDDEEDSAFVAEFEQQFGMKPDEARTLVDELVNFRNEVNLMRQWKVDATEYDSRMSQVKEFYSSLPAEGREQFNSPEGAVAIWEHLSKNNPQPKQKKTTRSGRSVGSQPKSAPKFEFKRSEINAMNREQLESSWSSINNAYLRGRILEDV